LLPNTTSPVAMAMRMSISGKPRLRLVRSGNSARNAAGQQIDPKDRIADLLSVF
jgi:hypothetical protein